MRITRRQFIHRSVAGVSLVLAERTLAAPKPEVDPFAQVTLGGTGIKVSRIGMGTGMKGWKRESNQTRMGQEAFTALVRGAFERGVTFFDCADLYGSHALIAKAFAGVPRDRYVIASKIWFRENGLPEEERPDADVTVARFLKELNTDYVDMVQIHCMTDGDWTEKMKRQMDILDALKKKGAIRAHGVSIHSLPALEACPGTPWIDVIHTRVNAFGDKMDDKDPAKVVPVIQRIHKAGKGVVGMKLIGEGKYRDDPQKRDESIRYVLGLGAVDTMIVGFEKLEEIDDFSGRMRAALLARA